MALVQLLVILVPVLFGLIGFAVDLGMLYSMRGELKTGAAAMALAGAQQLIGTDTATASSDDAIHLTSNNYYFHGFPIGQSTGSLMSTVSDPMYYSTAADAVGNGSGGAAGAQSRYVRVSVTGQMQTLFWGFLPLFNGSRNLTVAATAVAGISPPLCLGCGIEPIGVAAIDSNDTMDFGFVPGTKYSLTYQCMVGNNIPPPAPLAGTAQVVFYLLMNRYDSGAVTYPDPASQAFQYAAGGLPGSLTNAACPAGQNCACFRYNNAEAMWPGTVVNSCTAPIQPLVTDTLCGLDARFENTPGGSCAGIPSIDTLSNAYTADTDSNDYDTYTDYTGKGRRIITAPILDPSMTVLGFRQFLLDPTAQGGNVIDSGDTFGRFAALYIGSVAPVPQGRFDGCRQTAGPGKVVLHQ